MADNGFVIEEEFDFDVFNLDEEEPAMNDRYMKPIKTKELREDHLLFENAIACAKKMTLSKNTRTFFLIAGSFVFGDLIEALAVEKNLKISKLSISTLSLNENNIDSIVNLFDGNYLDELELVVSDYFYSHERWNLIQYAYAQLDKKNRFQLAVASVHTKICLMDTDKGKFVLHGSSNLRSSNCVEQIIFEQNDKLFDFCATFHDEIVSKYKTINKAVRNKELWRTINKKTL